MIPAPLLAAVPALAATASLGVSAVTTDTPIEPIPLSTIEILIATDDSADGICSTAGEYGQLVRTLEIIVGEPGVADMMIDGLVGAGLDSFEDGFGPNAALTREAEERFEGWIRDCVAAQP